MAEYIEREALLVLLGKLFMEPPYQHDGENYYCGVAIARQEIEEIPTADVVEVVRCKDCVYYIPNEKLADGYDNAIGADGLCDNTDLYTWEDDYCSDGRKG